MWLFTRYGFFSAVANDKQNPDKICVRARSKKHLKNLLDFLRVLIAPKDNAAKIHETKDADYRYRIYMNHGTWSRVAEMLADDINYPNFKDSIPKKNKAYVQALHRIWSVMYNFQLDGEE